MYKRMGFPILTQSPRLEFIEPIGHGPQFHFTRPQSGDYSSHPSSNSGHACAASPQESDDDDDEEEDGSDSHSDSSSESEESHTTEDRPAARRVEEAAFELEEVDTDPDLDSDTEVVRPDQFEDASSEKATEERLEADTGIISSFSNLRCETELNAEEEQRLNYRKKKKRWSAGIFKRSHSQSVGSDTDIEDSEALDAHDVGSSARRLRRRVRGPGDRSSMIFDEMPNTNIVEVEEPDDAGSGKGPPSIPSDEGFTLDALPFWVLDDPMDMDWDSSRPSSAT